MLRHSSRILSAISKHAWDWLNMKVNAIPNTTISTVLNSTTDPDSFYFRSWNYQKLLFGVDEILLLHCNHIATSATGNRGTGANNHRFAFVITDEDIDLTKDTPTKEATLKASKMQVSLLTVVGKTYKSIKKTLIHWSMEQMVHLDIRKILLTSVERSICQQSLKPFKRTCLQVQQIWVDLKTHRVAKANQTLKIQTPGKTDLSSNQLL